MLDACERPRLIAAHFGISVLTVWRIALEPAITTGDDLTARRALRRGACAYTRVFRAFTNSSSS